MIPLIARHSDELAELCRRHHVKRLEVFGSAAVGDFNPETSDIDFLVEFDDSDEFLLFQTRRDLTQELESLFNRSVDIVIFANVENPYFRTSVESTRNRSLRHDPNTYLWDIQQAAQRINSLTAETTFDEYNGDWQVSLLVERLFIIIGETTVIPALAGIQKGRRGANLTTIPQIIGFRIVLVHRYPEIRNQEVWEIIQQKLPNLITEVNTLLEQG